MRYVHGIAVLVCATAPYVWIASIVVLLVRHGGSIMAWSGDDLLALAGIVVALPLFAFALLRIRPLPRRTHHERAHRRFHVTAHV